METSSTKKTLFRALMVVLCLLALGVFFQTGQSQSMFSTAPLPTIEITLRPGVEWMTVRNLPVEASTIWQENGQVFAVSRPLINSARDAALYEELLEDRLNSLPDEQVLTAEVTFKAPLSLAGIETLLRQYTIISLLASGEGGSTGQVAYHPDDVPAELQDEFSQVYEAISGGTPAPSLSPDHYIAATVRANVLLLRDLAQKERVFTVDVGPVDLISDFSNGNFSPLKDVSYDYELHVGSGCEFGFLRNRIDDLSTNGEIPEVVKDELKDILTNAETHLNANDVVSARSEMTLFFETLTENSAIIVESALKEVGIIGDCIVAREMQSNPLVNAGSDQTINLGNSVIINATYSDADNSEPHSARINWGDGTTEEAGVNMAGPGDGEVSGQHAYAGLGNYTVEICVTDIYGGVGCDTTSITVLYHFTGFFPPIDNQPVLNVVKAGSAVPVKFSLDGYWGASIFANGYPASAVVSCGAFVEDAIEQTITAGSSSLSYDATTDQYIYVWKTDKAWADTCRTFVLKLNDGSYHRADFKFKK